MHNTCPLLPFPFPFNTALALALELAGGGLKSGSLHVSLPWDSTSTTRLSPDYTTRCRTNAIMYGYPMSHSNARKPFLVGNKQKHTELGTLTLGGKNKVFLMYAP